MPSRSPPTSWPSTVPPITGRGRRSIDGKDVPITGTTPYGPGTVASLTRVDAHTTKVVGKRNGEVVLTQTIVTSADGKTRTLTTKRKDANGQPVEIVSLYDKQ